MRAHARMVIFLVIAGGASTARIAAARGAEPAQGPPGFVLDELDRIVRESRARAAIDPLRKIRFERTDRFPDLPPPTLAELRGALPKHRFYVATMEYFLDYHRGFVDIILAADAAEDRVVAHAWRLGFAAPSKSFCDLLRSYRPRDEEDARRKLKALADLLIFPWEREEEGHVGKVYVEGRTVKAELWYMYEKGQRQLITRAQAGPDDDPIERGPIPTGPRDLLEVELEENGQFGRLSLR